MWWWVGLGWRRMINSRPSSFSVISAGCAGFNSRGSRFQMSMLLRVSIRFRSSTILCIDMTNAFFVLIFFVIYFINEHDLWVILDIAILSEELEVNRPRPYSRRSGSDSPAQRPSLPLQSKNTQTKRIKSRKAEKKETQMSVSRLAMKHKTQLVMLMSVTRPFVISSGTN